jgi:hypothetical protein
MRHPIRWLVVLVVLAALVAGLDRLAAHVAAGRIATAVQTDAHLAHKPKVDVHGFPFLTQAVGGKYNRIEVTAADVFDSLGSSLTTVNFEGVHISASNALDGKVGQIPVDHVTGSVRVSFSDVEAASHIPGVKVQPVAGQPDELEVGESVDVAGLSVAASVIAHVSASGNTITLKATDVRLPAGAPVPSGVLDQIRSHAGFSVTVPGLPTGVRLTGVTVGADGVTATLRADDIVLTH